jgi:2,3-bisphosphoglycerate-dependent phosphoglycerate mutase
VTDEAVTGAFHQLRYARPPGATEILLVRHGQSAAYVPGRPFTLVDGQGDPPLSVLGAEQAQQVGARLNGIDAIYVTNLTRTAQTAAPLAARLGLTPKVEPRLREVNLGEWEGGLFRKMMSEQGLIAQRVLAEERYDVIPGAEPAAEFADRVRAALTDLAAAHPDQRVAVFTHGGVIGRALALASGSRPFAFNGAENTSISLLVIRANHWLVRGFNDTAHLDWASG